MQFTYATARLLVSASAVVAEQSFRVKMYGGEFGIESSVIAIGGYLLASLAAVWVIRRRREQRE